jgi:pilus assembly protein Flp/PilA
MNFNGNKMPSRRTSGGGRVAIPSSRFLDDQAGTTAIEYAIIAAGIGVAIAATVYALGATVMTDYYNVIASAIGR